MIVACIRILTPTFHCHSDIDDSDDDESFNENENESADDDTDGTDKSEASDEASISEDELQGLEDDLKMPASAKKPAKKSTTPKKVAAVEEITELASGLAISSGTKSSWYSPSYQFPYVIYAFKDENHPVEHCVVELLAPTVPNEFIRSFQVMACGTKLKVLIGTPRWFFEHSFIERRLGADYHAQHTGVENFETNVVQPVRSKFKDNDPWIEGAPVIIPLPKKCHVGDVTWQRGTWRTRGLELVAGQVQFNWVISIMLKTTKVYELRNDVAAVQQYAGLDDADAM